MINALIKVLVFSSELETFRINYEKCELLLFDMAKKVKNPIKQVHIDHHIQESRDALGSARGFTTGNCQGGGGHGIEVWRSTPSLLMRRVEAKMMRRIFGCARRPAPAALHWLVKILPTDTVANAQALRLAAKILDKKQKEGEPALELLAFRDLIEEFMKFKTGW